MVTARCATPHHQMAILALWKQFMTEESQAVPDADIAAAVNKWRERLASAIDRGHVYILEDEGGVQGFAMWIDAADKDWIPDGIAYVVDIYLSPERRKWPATGILISRLLEACRKLGYREIWTNTHNKNRRVQILLDLRGFVRMNDFEIPGIQDQVYFRLPLS